MWSMMGWASPLFSLSLLELYGGYKQRTPYELLRPQRRCGCTVYIGVISPWDGQKKTHETARCSIFHCHMGGLVSREAIESNFVCHCWEKHSELFTVWGGIFSAVAKSIYYELEKLNVFFIKYYPWVVTVLWWNEIRNCGSAHPAFRCSQCEVFQSETTCHLFDTQESFDQLRGFWCEFLFFCFFKATLEEWLKLQRKSK